MYSEFQTDYGPLSVKHNSDWSGMAYIFYTDPDTCSNGGRIIIENPRAIAVTAWTRSRKSTHKAKGNTIVIRENNGQNARWFDSESELKHWLQFSR